MPDEACIRKLRHDVANKKAIVVQLKSRLRENLSPADRHSTGEEIRRQEQEISSLERQLP